ncbi:MAG: hypothetical protein GC191_08960 [Azospirillum sp.]|nr:hypothetical protein [Azospirillum sp.]
MEEIHPDEPWARHKECAKAAPGFAIEAAAEEAGMYLDWINKTDLSTFTPDEFMTLISAIAHRVSVEISIYLGDDVPFDVGARKSGLRALIDDEIPFLIAARDDAQERAAIMEFDGNVSRSLAEQRAIDALPARYLLFLNQAGGPWSLSPLSTPPKLPPPEP